MNLPILEDNKILSYIYYLVLFICLGVSGYETAIGYEKIAGPISWAIAAVLVLSMTGLILLKLQDKDPSFSSGQLMLYLSLVFVSFAGNYNAFFSSYIKKQAIKEESEKWINEFSSIKTQTDKVLGAENTYDSDQTEISIILTTLESEISNNGIGTEAKKKIEKIELLVGGGVKLSIPSPDLTTAEQYQFIEKQVLEISKKNISKFDKIVSVKTIVDSLSNVGRSNLYDSRKTQNLDDDISSIKEGVVLYNEIGNTVEKFINNPNKFEFVEESDDISELGSIVDSFVKSFQKQFILPAVFLAIFSLLIDLVPLFLQRALRKTDLQKMQERVDYLKQTRENISNKI